MLMPHTNVNPFGILKKQTFDIVAKALFNCRHDPERSVYKIHVLQICSYLEPQGVSRHDFERIRHEMS